MTEEAWEFIKSVTTGLGIGLTTGFGILLAILQGKKESSESKLRIVRIVTLVSVIGIVFGCIISMVDSFASKQLSYFEGKRKEASQRKIDSIRRMTDSIYLAAGAIADSLRISLNLNKRNIEESKNVLSNVIDQRFPFDPLSVALQYSFSIPRADLRGKCLPCHERLKSINVAAYLKGNLRMPYVTIDYLDMKDTASRNFIFDATFYLYLQKKKDLKHIFDTGDGDAFVLLSNIKPDNPDVVYVALQIEGEKGQNVTITITKNYKSLKIENALPRNFFSVADLIDGYLVGRVVHSGGKDSISILRATLVPQDKDDLYIVSRFSQPEKYEGESFYVKKLNMSDFSPKLREVKNRRRQMGI